MRRRAGGFQVLANTIDGPAPVEATWLFADGFECSPGSWITAP